MFPVIDKLNIIFDHTWTHCMSYSYVNIIIIIYGLIFTVICIQHCIMHLHTIFMVRDFFDFFCKFK